ncbi:MAG: RNA methyltransferase [Proteobacteria bacterium]|nr:RNA methyltransferase [Pseudomonadota bacterium]MBU1708566.1 RNA methyltransferase [Pseudomonadota bacterium]
MVEIAISPARLIANVAIVLVEPKYPENIGASARSAMNMGISRLIVVAAEKPDKERMLKMATHNAAHLIEEMELFADLESALSPFSFVIGTTARLGRKRRAIQTPRHVAAAAVPILQNNLVALLFGPEDRGLTNDDLKYCHTTSTIPTENFSSLNLAQAVAIHCYEMYMATLQASRDENTRFQPKLADSFEIEEMYKHLENVLTTIGFLKKTDYEYWMGNIRHFLGRIHLRARDVRILRGLCRQFLWYDKKISTGGFGDK